MESMGNRLRRAFDLDPLPNRRRGAHKPTRPAPRRAGSLDALSHGRPVQTVAKGAMFGGMLEDAVDAATGSNKFVVWCVIEVERKGAGLSTENIYRAMGDREGIMRISRQPERHMQRALERENSVHVLTGSLKMFFKSLQVPAMRLEDFKPALQPHFNDVETVSLLREVVARISAVERNTLRFLFLHLKRVLAVKENHMTTATLSTTFGPTLMRLRREYYEQAAMVEEMKLQIRLVEQLLLHCDVIFGVILPKPPADHSKNLVTDYAGDDEDDTSSVSSKDSDKDEDSPKKTKILVANVGNYKRTTSLIEMRSRDKKELTSSSDDDEEKTPQKEQPSSSRNNSIDKDKQSADAKDLKQKQLGPPKQVLTYAPSKDGQKVIETKQSSLMSQKQETSSSDDDDDDGDKEKSVATQKTKSTNGKQVGLIKTGTAHLSEIKKKIFKPKVKKYPLHETMPSGTKIVDGNSSSASTDSNRKSPVLIKNMSSSDGEEPYVRRTIPPPPSATVTYKRPELEEMGTIAPQPLSPGHSDTFQIPKPLTPAPNAYIYEPHISHDIEQKDITISKDGKDSVPNYTSSATPAHKTTFAKSIQNAAYIVKKQFVGSKSKQDPNAKKTKDKKKNSKANRNSTISSSDEEVVSYKDVEHVSFNFVDDSSASRDDKPNQSSATLLVENKTPQAADKVKVDSSSDSSPPSVKTHVTVSSTTKTSVPNAKPVRLTSFESVPPDLKPKPTTKDDVIYASVNKVKPSAEPVPHDSFKPLPTRTEIFNSSILHPTDYLRNSSPAGHQSSRVTVVNPPSTTIYTPKPESSNLPPKTMEKPEEKPKPESSNLPPKTMEKPEEKPKPANSNIPPKTMDKPAEKPKPANSNPPPKTMDKPVEKPKPANSNPPPKIMDKPAEKPKPANSNPPPKATDKPVEKPKPANSLAMSSKFQARNVISISSSSSEQESFSDTSDEYVASVPPPVKPGTHPVLANSSQTNLNVPTAL